MVVRLAVALLLVAAQLHGEPGCVLRSVLNTGGVTLARAVATGGPLSEQDAIRCFDRLVPREIAPKKLLSLVIYADQSDLASLRGKGYAGEEVRNWAVWLKMLETTPAPRHAMAEVVQTSAGAVLRYRSEAGEVSKSVIRGRDPTVLRVEKSTFEVIHMVMSGRAPIFEDKPGGGVRLDVFLQSAGPLRQGDCLRATQDMSKQLDVPWVGTDFRTDPFFITSTAFPVLHPFVKLPALPTEQAYLQGGSIGCVVQYGKSWCLVWPTPDAPK